tara:strand:+ start:1375 stop:1533 length:159 start_codon:yes stop_codon:yes gene_type:complete
MNAGGFGRGWRHLLVDISDRTHAGLYQPDRSLNDSSCKGTGGEAGDGEKKSE